jgi:hypothetical protein
VSPVATTAVVLAQVPSAPPLPGDASSLLALAGAAAAALVVFGILVLFAARYKRCPANKILS